MTQADFCSSRELIIKLREIYKPHPAKLSDRALDLIATTHPDEDVTKLVVSELEFDRDSAFRLGYDAGETPAGC